MKKTDLSSTQVSKRRLSTCSMSMDLSHKIERIYRNLLKKTYRYTLDHTFDDKEPYYKVQQSRKHREEMTTNIPIKGNPARGKETSKKDSTPMASNLNQVLELLMQQRVRSMNLQMEMCLCREIVLQILTEIFWINKVSIRILMVVWLLISIPFLQSKKCLARICLKIH